MRFTVMLALLILAQGCNSQTEKINGVSYVAAAEPTHQKQVDPVVALNANYAAIMPFGFIRTLDNPAIIHNTDRQWFGETRDGAQQYIELLKKNNIKIMIKPQIWIWRGEFTGYLKMNSEADWQELEGSYRSFILEYAALAQEMQSDLFCIGTELEQFIIHRPDYWKKLIEEIRQVYKGKLTYAANWDEYKRVPFWNQLDYIGVDAYFPVSENKTPTVEQARLGWQPWKQEMLAVAKKADKKILFTEFGYRSVDYAGKEPWKSDRSMNQVNLEVQNNTYTALFDELWAEDWFAGGFIWKWFTAYDKVGGVDNAQFTPQNKPVEDIIRSYYKIHQ